MISIFTNTVAGILLLAIGYLLNIHKAVPLSIGLALVFAGIGSMAAFGTLDVRDWVFVFSILLFLVGIYITSLWITGDVSLMIGISGIVTTVTAVSAFIAGGGIRANHENIAQGLFGPIGYIWSQIVRITLKGTAVGTLQGARDVAEPAVAAGAAFMAAGAVQVAAVNAAIASSLAPASTALATLGGPFPFFISVLVSLLVYFLNSMPPEYAHRFAGGSKRRR